MVSKTLSLLALKSLRNWRGSKCWMCRHLSTHSVAFEFCRNLSSIYRSSRIRIFIRCHSTAPSVNFMLLDKLRFKLLDYFFIEMLFNHGLNYLTSNGSLLAVFLSSSLFSDSFLALVVAFCSLGMLFKSEYIISFCKFMAFFMNV